MTAEALLELEDKILSASKIMVNILAESLMHENVQGLSAPQFRILDMVFHGVDKPADVAKMLDVSPPALTWILEKLENMGFLERSHSDSDRRRVVLGLTSMGEDVVRSVNAYRRSLLVKVLGGMEDKEVAQLESALEAFSDSYMKLKEKQATRADA
jgi:DNA-binding MarR family transcriptional regulator